MKIQRLKKSLFCTFVGGGLFFAAHQLVGAPEVTSSGAVMAGFTVYLIGCLAFAASLFSRWVDAPKKQDVIDSYTAALVEMELSRQKKERNQLLPDNL
jgi:hypothetical protein